MIELTKNKEKGFERKKLSKSSNVLEPAVKKLKTLNSKTNDIYKHIKTMDSFFNSSEIGNPVSDSTLFSNNNDSLKECLTSPPPVNSKELPRNSPAQLQTTTLLPSAVSNMPGNMYSPNSESNKIQLSDTDHHFTPVTAERNQINAISSLGKTVFAENNSLVTNLNEDSVLEKSNLLVTDINIKSWPEKSNSLAIDINKNSMSEKNNSLVCDSNKYSNPEKSDNNCPINNVDFSDLFNLGDLNSKHFAPCVVNATVNDNNDSALNLNDALNFQTAKLILEKNQNILSINEQEPFKNTVSKNSSLPTSENQISSNVTASQNWSRGKHTIQDMQPVTVLMPQIVENRSTNVNDKEMDLKTLKHSVSNQRKMTAFDFFCRKNRLEIASLNPEMSNHRIAQILTEKWSKLSVEEKSIYKNMIDKPYSKNVKNKEKLGNCVKQNLNKMKVTPTKRKLKRRKKCMERIISFDWQTLHRHTPAQHNSNGSSYSDLADINIINCIAPGIWIFSQDNKICIFNTFRLQEMIIYHRLLDTFRFEPEQLEFPCILSNDTLGEEAVSFLCQLPKKECYMAETIVDERIIANGFELNLLKGQEDVQIQVVGMTRNIAFYSVLDLKEILILLKEKGPCAKLSECRPGKVVLFLQSEAVRMARQYPSSKSKQDVEDLLKSKELLPSNCDMCIHSKPFIHEITTLG